MNSESFKVYDSETEKWITDECVLAANGSLFKKKKRIFNTISLELISTEIELEKQEKRYYLYRCTNMLDCDNTVIFEGDILTNNDGVTGLITYSDKFGAYILLDYKNSTYYLLGQDVCKNLKVIDCVVNNPSLLVLRQRGEVYGI